MRRQPPPRPAMRHCGIHGARYPVWADAAHTQLGTCHACDEDKARAAALAAKRQKETEPRDAE